MKELPGKSGNYASDADMECRRPTWWERRRFGLSLGHRLVGWHKLGRRMTEMTWLDTFSSYRIKFTRGERWFSRWQEVRR